MYRKKSLVGFNATTLKCIDTCILYATGKLDNYNQINI